MPQNFGDAFVQSLQFGTKIAQEADQHAQAVAMKEKELAANQALEGLKMDALNRQIDIADKQALEDAKKNSTTAITDFNKAWIPVNRNNPYMRDQRLRTAEELKVLHPGVNIPQGEYLDAQSMQGILGMMMQDRARIAEQGKIDRINEPVDIANNFASRLAGIPEPQYKTEEVVKFPEKEANPFINLFKGTGKALGLIGSGIERTKKTTFDKTQMANAMNSLASLISDEATFLASHPKNPEFNQHPALVGARSKFWELMNQSRGQDIPVNPMAQSIMNKINNQYNALKFGWEEQTRQEANRISTMKDEEQRNLALQALQESRNAYNFEQLFKNLPFDPTLGVKTQAVKQPY